MTNIHNLYVFRRFQTGMPQGMIFYGTRETSDETNANTRGLPMPYPTGKLQVDEDEYVKESQGQVCLTKREKPRRLSGTTSKSDAKVQVDGKEH